MKRFLDDINRNFEQSLKTMFDLSPDGFLVADMKGNVLYASQAGKQMFGLDDSDIERGINLFDFVHEDDREQALKNVTERLKGNYEGFSDYKVIRKDGTNFWNETNAAIIRDSKGTPRTLFLVFRDISQRKAQETVLQKYTESLQELNNLKDKFFSIIAHDLKNPFNVMMSFSELLLDELNKKNIEKSIEFATIIKDTSMRGQALLTNLLDWARLQTGKIKVRKQLISLNEIIDEQINLIMPLAIEKEIEISVGHDKDITILTDKDILSTIFRNLLNNAVKYTNTGGKIKIGTLKVKSKLSVIFEDNGIGIDKNTQKRLFSIDTIQSTPGTKEEKGTGLGLILCRDLIALIEGEIHVESKLGIGSKFIVLLAHEHKNDKKNSF